MTSVLLSGALGQMGRLAVDAIGQEADLRLVGAVSRSHVGDDLYSVLNLPGGPLTLTDNLRQALANTRPEVCVDLTHPSVARENALAMAAAGVRPVIGTTGLSDADLDDLAAELSRQGIGGLVVPNFSLGAVLMMRFAQEAARHFAHAELVELHHDRKADAPSGTALRTVGMMTDTRPQGFAPPAIPGHESLPGARGAEQQGVRVHSVRLPGLVAHQEVLFGAPGELLTVRHDALDRRCYMPGLILAIRRVLTLDRLVVGLEHVL